MSESGERTAEMSGPQEAIRGARAPFAGSRLEAFKVAFVLLFDITGTVTYYKFHQSVPKPSNPPRAAAAFRWSTEVINGSLDEAI